MKKSKDIFTFFFVVLIALGGWGVVLLWDTKVIPSANPQQNTPSSYDDETSSTTSYAEYSNEELSEEDIKYLDNSLSTGAAPYKETYGANYICNRVQCSGIKVTAPHESDIVVIIKRGNSKGKVIQHGYIKAGNTYQFDVPDGRYQTFFYYGEGWNPNKEMPNGVIGGFVKNEIFSKDRPQDVYDAILTYVLQLQREGNFQTQTSNASEAL